MFCGRHFYFKGACIPTYQTQQTTPEMWFGRFDKPVPVWYKTNDQTAFGLVSTNG